MMYIDIYKHSCLIICTSTRRVLWHIYIYIHIYIYSYIWTLSHIYICHAFLRVPFEAVLLTHGHADAILGLDSLREAASRSRGPLLMGNDGDRCYIVHDIYIYMHYVYIYIHICIFLYICIYVFLHTYICRYIPYVYLYIYVYIYI